MEGPHLRAPREAAFLSPTRCIYLHCVFIQGGLRRGHGDRGGRLSRPLLHATSFPRAPRHAAAQGKDYTSCYREAASLWDTRVKTNQRTEKSSNGRGPSGHGPEDREGHRCTGAGPVNVGSGMLHRKTRFPVGGRRGGGEYRERHGREGSSRQGASRLTGAKGSWGHKEVLTSVITGPCIHSPTCAVHRPVSGARDPTVNKSSAPRCEDPGPPQLRNPACRAGARPSRRPATCPPPASARLL